MIETVAVGHQSASAAIGGGHPRRAILISFAHGRGHSVADKWRDIQGVAHQPTRRKAGADLIASVAQLFATSHLAGVVHRDAHPKNVLVDDLEDVGFAPVFADLYGARLRRGGGEVRQDEIRSLAQMDQYFHRCASGSDRLRFLRDYLSVRESEQPSRSRRARRRRMVTVVLSSRRRLASALARQRDRRLTKSGKYFGHIELEGGWSAWVVLELARRHVFPEPSVPDRDLSTWRALLESLLTCRPPASGLKVETAQPRGFLEAIRWRLGGSPHRRAFNQSHRSRHRDSWSVLHLAVMERRRFGRTVETILLTSP